MSPPAESAGPVPEELGLQGGSRSLRYFHSNAEGLKPGSKAEVVADGLRPQIFG